MRERPVYVDGRTLTPLLKTPDANWQSTAISALGTRYDDCFISFRNERFRCTPYNGDQEEFYDCEKDPHEWINQIDNPEYRAEIEERRASVPALSEMATPMASNKGRSKMDKTERDAVSCRSF